MKKIILSLCIALSFFTHSTSLKAEVIMTNSGIVLSTPFLPRLMSRLQLTVDNKFVDSNAQNKCVLVLHYAAAGSDLDSDQNLDLFKILCGLPLTAKINFSKPIFESDKEMVESLIGAMISQWPAIGNSSNAGFRGNWFLRGGNLIENEENWMLSVDRRAYDILLQKCPYFSSRIQLPWMSKTLLVSW